MEAESHKSFEEVRAEVESSQKSILWEGARRGGRSVDAFLWKGDPNAKPIQRMGLIVFALAFLLISIAAASVPFAKHFGDGWAVEFLMAAAALGISARLIRNALRRSTEVRMHSDDE